MAELGLGTAAIGAGAALGAAVYTAATGFFARHASVHSLQVTEIRRNVTDFEAAYGRGEVTEEWQIYLAIRQSELLILLCSTREPTCKPEHGRKNRSMKRVLRRTRRRPHFALSQSGTKGAKYGRRRRHYRERIDR
jgi:hypothetical protein